jgi:hypothetical protein
MLAALALATTALCVATPARADLAAEARFHDEAARGHYTAGRYDAAVREFMIENRLAPNPNIVLNIAFCFQQMNRREEAFMYFSEYLAATEDVADRRAQAQQALARLRPEVALVQVDSEPAGATIFVDRPELGEYGRTPRLLALPAGEHRVWIQREGYRQAEQTVTVVVGREVSVNLQPEQILGRLHLVATAEAEVRVSGLDGTAVWEGSTPVDTALPPGTYSVEAIARGGDRWSEPVTIRPEASTEIEAELVGPSGSANVVASQAGALVRIDGHDMGFTPQVLTDIPIGEHRLEVSADGAQPYSGTLGIEEDMRAWVSVSLSPSAGSIPNAETWTLGGISLALLAGAGVFTALAATAHSQFQNDQMMGLGTLDSAAQANSMAVTADLLWLAGGGAALGAVVMLIVSLEQGSRPSSATVTQEEP